MNKKVGSILRDIFSQRSTTHLSVIIHPRYQMSSLFAISFFSVYAPISWHLLPQVRKHLYTQDTKHVMDHRASLKLNKPTWCKPGGLPQHFPVNKCWHNQLNNGARIKKTVNRVETRVKSRETRQQKYWANVKLLRSLKQTGFWVGPHFLEVLYLTKFF